jgi:hypothetical protein
MSQGGEMGAGGNEALFDHGKRLADQGVFGDQEQIATRRHQFLMPAKEFAQTPLGLVAQHGMTDGGNRGDDSDATQWRWRILTGEPPKRKKATMDPVTVFPHAAEITLASQVLLRA